MIVMQPLPRVVDARRYVVPDLETRKATAVDMVDSLLAADETTAMMLLNNPRSWPER